jgi:hypothetical protein
MTAYSLYLQLPSVSGDIPSICNLQTRHAMVSSDPPNMTVPGIFKQQQQQQQQQQQEQEQEQEQQQ